MTSDPFSVKVWQDPPATSCCSRTRTFFPPFDKIAAVVSPEMPLPTMMASRSIGTFSAENLSFRIPSLTFLSLTTALLLPLPLQYRETLIFWNF